MKEAKHTLDLNPIFKGDKKELALDFDFVPECIENDITFNSPIHSHLRVYEKAAAAHGSESLVMAEISLSGSYQTSCARCVCELEVPMEVSASYAVTLKLENEEDIGDDVLIASDGILDASEHSDALFFMNLPSKHLCSEDCKGICQGCGKNLNFEECSCTGKNIDPRLAVLKKLLDK